MRTLQARVWHTSTIASILHNTTYIGALYYGKTQRLPGKSNPDTKTRHRHVPREEWTPIAVPPIIDQVMFEAAQAQLLRSKSQSKRNRKHEYLFVSGHLRCGQCGGGMSGEINYQESARYRCVRGHQRSKDVIMPHNRRRCWQAL